MPRVRRPADPDGVAAVAPLASSTAGGSGSFLVRADDGRRYWCKTLNNFQHPKVPANEQLVGRLGALIGAPVCEVALVKIPQALVGWEFRPGRPLEEGWVHGSLAADLVVETRDMTSRTTDDNPKRHAGIYALHDWLGGSDAQWLMVGAEAAYYSHDHGHYFPGGPDWSAATLNQAAGAAFQLGHPATGLDAQELARLANVLEGLNEQEIAFCASNLPTDWPVTDDELEALVGFVDARRAPVAQRLRGLLGAV